jgi:hypothetical protein
MSSQAKRTLKSSHVRPVAPTSVVADLSKIPGVGPSLAADLYSLGVNGVAELRGRDSEMLYAELCERVGHRVDRCVLYVFRCAVYFASEQTHDRELLKWWNWKDKDGRPNGDKAPGRCERIL